GGYIFADCLRQPQNLLQSGGGPYIINSYALIGTISYAMNSLDFDALQIRIIEYLKRKGPTTSERLAREFDAPSGNVRFALEQMRWQKEQIVTLLPFGLWAL